MLEMERLRPDASPDPTIPDVDDRDSLLKLKSLESLVAELVENVFWELDILVELDELEKELAMLEDMTREEKLLLVFMLPLLADPTVELHPP